MRKSTLLLLAVFASVTTAFASDFEENGMYFTITSASDQTVEIAPKSAYENRNLYSGTVEIPSTIEHDGITYTVTGIGKSTFNACSSLFAVVIPQTVTYIEVDAFRSAYNLGSLELPASLERIGNMAFEGSGLGSIVIPDKVQVIGNMTFSKCYNLSSIVLGKGVHTIEQNAFYESPNLGEVTVLNTTPPQLDERGFSNWNATIYVPRESVSRYEQADQWNRFANIKAVEGDEEQADLNVKFHTSNSYTGVGEEVTVSVQVYNEGIWAVEWSLPEGVTLTNGSLYDEEITVLAETEGQKAFTVKLTNEDENKTATQTRRLFDVLSADDLAAVGNVALLGSIHSFSGSQANNTKEKPDNLLDGETSPTDISRKWCNDASNHWVIIDLEGLYNLYGFRIYDCKAGHENYSNISNYRIQVSTDAENWDLVVDETGRSDDNVKTDYILPTKARFVRFNPYANSSFTIRIWEFEAYGVEVSNNMKITAPAPSTVKGGGQKTLAFAYDLQGDERAADFFATATIDNEYLTIDGITDDAENGQFLVSVSAARVFGYGTVTLTANNGGARRSASASLTIDSDADNVISEAEVYEQDGQTWVVASAKGTPWKVAKISGEMGGAEPMAVSFLLSLGDKEQWTEVFRTNDFNPTLPLDYILPQYRDALHVAMVLTPAVDGNWNGSLKVYEQLPDGIKEQEPVAIASGWNADVVAEALPAAEHSNMVLDDQGWVLYTNNVFSEGGIPADGIITAESGNIFQIADLAADNAVCLKQANAPQTLTFVTPQQASEVQLLSISANGESKLLVTVNYDDGTTAEQTFSIADWFSGRSGQGEALYGLSRVITRKEADWKADDKDYRNQFRLFEQTIATNPAKVITSVTLTSTKSGSYPTVIAISRTGHSTATGIVEVKSEELKVNNSERSIYNLAGQRLERMQKGINIVNGKKILK